MFAQKNSKASGPVTFLPVIFGSVGLVILGVYQAQRGGVFLHSFYSFDRFIQHHLDAVAGFGSSATLLGVDPANATCDVEWRQLLDHIAAPATSAPPSPSNVRRFELGTIDGIALGFTDATLHEKALALLPEELRARLQK